MKKVVHMFVITPKLPSGIEIHIQDTGWMRGELGTWVKNNARSVTYWTSDHTSSMHTSVSIVADFTEEVGVLYDLKKDYADNCSI